MKKIIIHKELLVILFTALILRIVLANFYADNILRNEWNMILHNHEISGVFGLNVVINEFLALPKLAEIGDKVLPTVIIPPLYLYLIYLVKLIFNNPSNIADIVISIQIFLSLFSILVFDKIIKLFSKKNSINIILLSIFSFFPMNVFAASQISSITLQIFLILNFFYFLFLFNYNKNIKNLLLFSFFSGLLILIRGEFFLFYFFTIIYFFLFIEKNIRFIMISFIVVSMLVTPYIFRNYQNFDKLVLTKSFGYNLLKGNNPSFKVEGDYEIIKKIQISEKNIKTDNNYEINLDNLFKEKALEFIKEEPLSYIKLYFKKIFSFFFIDFNSTYPNYYNLMHLAPKITLSIVSLFGTVLAIKKRGNYQFLALYFILSVLLFSIFFILPRYNLILLPIQLILCLKCIDYLRKDREFKF
tara:strand:+ start:1107 stop:2351 length:1245 start_codon:yes stop_codon:yes gene_type:complete